MARLDFEVGNRRVPPRRKGLHQALQLFQPAHVLPMDLGLLDTVFEPRLKVVGQTPGQMAGLECQRVLGEVFTACQDHTIGAEAA
jgi:hypothetical protein